LADTGAGEIKFEIRKSFSHTDQQAARAGFLPQPAPLIAAPHLRTDGDTVSTKGALILPEQTTFRILLILKRSSALVLRKQHARKTPDDSRLKSEFNGNPGCQRLEEFVVHHSNRFGAESDLSFDPARKLFFQALECPLTTNRIWRV